MKRSHFFLVPVGLCAVIAAAHLQMDTLSREARVDPLAAMPESAATAEAPTSWNLFHVIYYNAADGLSVDVSRAFSDGGAAASRPPHAALASLAAVLFDGDR